MPTVRLNLTKSQLNQLYNAFMQSKPFDITANSNTFNKGDGEVPLVLTLAELDRLQTGKGVQMNIKRVKKGGFLPALLPLIATALPSLATAGINAVKGYYDVSDQKAKIVEERRRNKAMEDTLAFLMKKVGHGFEITQEGGGFFLNPRPFLG